MLHAIIVTLYVFSSAAVFGSSERVVFGLSPSRTAYDGALAAESPCDAEPVFLAPWCSREGTLVVP